MLKETQDLLLMHLSQKHYQTVISLIKTDVLGGIGDFSVEKVDWFYLQCTQEHQIELFKLLINIDCERNSLVSSNKVTLIKKLLKKAKDENNAHLLLEALLHAQFQDSTLKALTYSYERTFLIIDILSSISNQEKHEDLFNKFLLHGIASCNVRLVQAIQNHNPLLFEKWVVTLDREHQAIVNNLLHLNDDRGIYINKVMHSFTRGFGHLNYESALVALAARRDKKKAYDFDPVLLKTDKDDPTIDEFKTFFQTLADAQKPIHQRFVGINEQPHWFAGEVLIEDDLAKIWIVDSLGAGSNVAGGYFSDRFQNQFPSFLQSFVETFPNHEIYASKEQRQDEKAGCSIFALDDINHSYNLHLGEHKDIWAYLSSASTTRASEIIRHTNGVTVSVCPVPIAYLATTQSTRRFETSMRNRSTPDRSLLINKKNETVVTACAKFFSFSKEIPLVAGSHQETQSYFSQWASFFGITTEEPKKDNTRLYYKLNNISKVVALFLLKYTPSEIEEKCEFFKAANYPVRINYQRTSTQSNEFM